MINKLYINLVIFLVSIAMSQNVYSAPPSKCVGSKIYIYGKSSCIFCKKAKELLKEENIEFQEIEIKNAILASWLYARTNQKTVPYVFIEDQFLGGYTELKALCGTKTWWQFYN